MNKVYKATGYIRFFGEYDFLIIVDKFDGNKYYQIEVSNLVTMDKDITPREFKDFKTACSCAEELQQIIELAALTAENKILLNTNKIRNM